MVPFCKSGHIECMTCKNEVTSLNPVGGMYSFSLLMVYKIFLHSGIQVAN